MLDLTSVRQQWSAAKLDSLTEVRSAAQALLLSKLEGNFYLFPLAVGIPLYGDQFFVDILHLPIAFEGLGCVGNEPSLSDCVQETFCVDCIGKRNTEPFFGCTSASQSVAVSCEGNVLVSMIKY